MSSRRFTIVTALALLAMPAAAQAGACEDGFTKKGNMILGSKFSASQAVADMAPDVAINQLRGIVAQRGYDIIAAEPETGALLIEQARTANSRAFPIEFQASQENGLGTVRVEAKLPAGMNTKADAVKAELCGMLTSLKGGKAGRLAAAGGKNAVTQQAGPVIMSAQEFSQQISKDYERNSAIVPLRYAGKKYTMSGTVDYVIKDGSSIRVAYKILQPHELALRLPNMASTLFSVSCMMAPGTSVFTLQLKPGKSIKLTGTYAQSDEFRDAVWFKDCVPVK